MRPSYGHCLIMTPITLLGRENTDRNHRFPKCILNPGRGYMSPTETREYNNVEGMRKVYIGHLE